MTTLSQKILILISSFLGIESIPKASNGWHVDNAWVQNSSGHYYLKASSKAIISECLKNRDSYIEFPPVIHSASTITVNDHIIASYGDPTFRKTMGFYGSNILPCHRIPSQGGTLSWQVWSYTKYFARISWFPRISASYPFSNFFCETLNIIAFGILIIFSFFWVILFRGKIPFPQVMSLLASNLSIALYFLGTVSGFFSISYPMLITHKLADAGLWLGFIFFFNYFRQEKLVKKQYFLILSGSVLIALIIILTASDGDQVQLGTSIPFLPTLLISLHAINSLYRKKKSLKSSILPLTALGIFNISCFNDIFVVLGVTDLYPSLPLGIMGCFTFILLSVNDEINNTYTQRDEFKKISNELKKTNADLKEAQAKIVHKSRLEALGTLSAGIAHEINNPLNHVYSFLNPLKSKIKNIPEQADRQKSLKAIAAMKDCLEMVFAIINSLKNFSSLNRSSLGLINIKESALDVLTILKSKLKGINITMEINENLATYTDRVSFNQILVNLLVNASDAIKVHNKGQIRINGRENGDEIIVEISDNGSGISEEIKQKIFDPFFTTKKISEGMGLGLHICVKEVEKLGGHISFRSEIDQGTTFTVCLPRKKTIGQPR